MPNTGIWNAPGPREKRLDSHRHEPASDARPPSSIHVLVVEDDAVSRDVAYQMLSHFGYRVRTVDSGLNALAALREMPCDIVLMDCRMIDMDGLETTRRLRAGEAGPNGMAVPIVALTAQGFVADRDACLAAGMNDFLTKPVVLDSLISAVERWAHAPARGNGTPVPMASLPEQHPAARAPVFDPGVLASLPMVADGSQPDYGLRVLRINAQTAPQLLATLRRAALADDAPTVRQTAHTLKSSSAAVGAMALAACAAQAEAHVRSGNRALAHLPDLLDHEFDKLREHLP